MFDGEFVSGFPASGTYKDERGAWFTVEVQERTYIWQFQQLGNNAFKSKVPLQVAASG